MIAIHKSSSGFSGSWIKYCAENSILYKEVNCYDTDIVKHLKGCKALLWHHHHSLTKDAIFAKQLLFAIEQAGIKVFPNFNTGWHFDDKLGQKYLLEAIEAPIAPTYVFYNKMDAINWAYETTFPKVFKLRCGAGSLNVKKVRDKASAINLINKAFSRGFERYNRIENLRENLRFFRKRKSNFVELLKSFIRIIVSTEYSRTHRNEKGYIMFQDFIPDNKFDIRVITIGERAFAIKRIVREGDFRASGSGNLVYNRDEIDINCVRIAFEVTKKLKAQVVGYDFVFDKENNPLIVEINYGYAHESYFDCPGFWDINLNWHQQKFDSTNWIIDLLID
jgi:glutathione synthase/RimK-type ligase-like ATP-grasp enzyme